MQQQRRRYAVAVVFAVTMLLSSCAEEAVLPSDADPELRAGADVYRARCASCHGADGGGAIGPTLRDIDERLDDAGQRDVVVTGRKAMPSFGSVLSDADIDAVVRYTREIL